MRGETFGEITLKYVNFVLTKFGKSIIVFDGYHFSSTKDMTHRTRTKDMTHRRRTKGMTHRRRTKDMTHRRRTKDMTHRRRTKDMTHRRRTEGMTHRRRTKGKTGVLVTFPIDMQLSISEDVFLLNKTNKQIFIEFLGSALTSFGCLVHHADADADVLNVQKAVESAESQKTILIREDTDLLVLLIHYAKESSHDILFTSHQKSKKAQRCGVSKK